MDKAGVERKEDGTRIMPLPSLEGSGPETAPTQDVFRRGTETTRIKLRINGVELGLPCVEVKVGARSIGCLLVNEVDCEFPDTEDAFLEHGGLRYPVLFAGQRVKFDGIPWQIIQFIRQPGVDPVPVG